MNRTNSKVFANLCFLVCLLAFSSQVWAHHGSRVSYDLSKTLTLQGTVTEFAWGNPHVYFSFDVTDDKGNVTNWFAETDPPLMMVKNYGWSKSYLKIGDKITVTVWPAKVGTPRGFLAKLVTADGKVTDHSAPLQ